MKKLLLILTLAAFASGPLMAVETAAAPAVQKVAGKKHKKAHHKGHKKHRKGHKPGKHI